MSILVNTYDKWDVRQHNCKTCGDLLFESGSFRWPNHKEIRPVKAWRKEAYHVRYLYHPADACLPESKRRIISVDVFCKCDRCGKDNRFIVSTVLNNPKGGIKVTYNSLSGGQAKLYT